MVPLIIPDRTNASKYAWEITDKNDIIAITSKGPDPYTEEFMLLSKTDAETIKYLFELRKDLSTAENI
ncbi:hypothetical protein [Niallia sp. FSL R7-0271]|uniref:hypothetical protein n=1 Tax=Niallia sp. FSL R7-0271 TaxID=2921678 RepID=UPI0030FAA1CA